MTEPSYVGPLISLSTWPPSSPSHPPLPRTGCSPPQIDEKCPKCGHGKMYFYTMQLRSVDEGSTVFYECVKCAYVRSPPSPPPSSSHLPGCHLGTDIGNHRPSLAHVGLISSFFFYPPPDTSSLKTTELHAWREALLTLPSRLFAPLRLLSVRYPPFYKLGLIYFTWSTLGGLGLVCVCVCVLSTSQQGTRACGDLPSLGDDDDDAGADDDHPL